MTKDYYKLIDIVNKSKFYTSDVITSFDTYIEKTVALNMWYYDFDSCFDKVDENEGEVVIL